MTNDELKRFYSLVMEMQKQGYRMNTITSNQATFTQDKEEVSFSWDGTELKETGRKKIKLPVAELF